jgi:hypothetical protein
MGEVQGEIIMSKVILQHAHLSATRGDLGNVADVVARRWFENYCRSCQDCEDPIGQPEPYHRCNRISCTGILDLNALFLV